MELTHSDLVRQRAPEPHITKQRATHFSQFGLSELARTWSDRPRPDDFWGFLQRRVPREGAHL